MNLTDKAKEYLRAGLSVIPVSSSKIPRVGWTKYQKESMTEEEAQKVFDSSPGLAIICGEISGSLEVIDVDCKYDLTGSLWEDYIALLKDNLYPVLFTALVIARTKSGGYHIYYRSEEIGRNDKLARRPATPQELQAGDKVKVLIETRGEGGYVVAPPTPGYEYIQGDPQNIPIISPQDRALILNIARSFNEIPEEAPVIHRPTPSAPYTQEGLSPFEDYNLRGDVIGLMERHGWKVVGGRGEKIYLLRPGQTDSKTSGNYHTSKRLLWIWSTSTEFNSEKAYPPSNIYALLECGGDLSEASRRLYGEGYGDRRGKANQVKTERIKVEIVNKANEISSVISSPGEILKIESLETSTGAEVVITSPGPEATQEVLKAIALIEETGKRIYIKEGNSPEVRDYDYRLTEILNRYSSRQGPGGALSFKDQDNFLDEVVTTASQIHSPIDRDLFIGSLLRIVEPYGITKESLEATVEKLRYKKDKETQAKGLKKILSEATQLRDKGEMDKALEILDKGMGELKKAKGKDLLPTPLSYEGILEEIAKTPPAFKTGYRSLDKFIGFTPGAITLIAGRPGHGKTTFMFNLLLEMSRLYKDKGYKFYFFTYEEPTRNLSIKLLNRLTASELKRYFKDYPDLAKPTNYEFIKAYIRSGRSDIKEIEEGKRKLQELIDGGLITVIDRNYSVEELRSLIAWLNSKEKIGAIFIDYIQRMRTERKTQDKRTEIAHISDQVLQIAKENNLPLILGAQLNRATLSSSTKGATLENLKEAGNLEEDANTVISVYCEAREKEEDQVGEKYSTMREVDLEIKVLKNREGEVNTKEVLSWDRWESLIKEWVEK